MGTRFVLLLVTAALAWSTHAASLQTAEAHGRLGATAREALAGDAAVRVLVTFRPSAADLKSGADAPAVAKALVEQVDRGTLRLQRSFRHVDAMALVADAAAIEALLADPRVLRVDLDVGGHAGLNESLPLAAIAPLHVSGLDGDGRTIAVLDSGHAPTHAAFAGRVAAEYCYCSGNGGCCPNGQASQSGSGAATDDNGHGSNVSGIALGSTPRGVAPAARLLSLKVLDRQGSFCCSSDIVAGLDRLIAEHPEVDVVNLSLGTTAVFGSACDSATSWAQATAQAVNQLHQRGALVVASSLNSGNRFALPSPACLSNVLAVGAVWDADLGQASFTQGSFSCSEVAQADQLTCFSNTTAMLDLVAPGARLTAAGHSGGTSTYSGTSQAAPMVAGCVALLRQARPQASPSEMIDALRASEVRVTESATGRQYPRLDCNKALASLAVPEVIDSSQVGSQYWLTGAGVPDGLRLDAELLSATGTVFGDAFNAADVQRKRWGRITIEFSGCNEATLQWDSTATDSAGFGTGGYPLLRIAATAESQRCEQVGVDAMPDRAWMAGTWYGGPTRDGEGVFLDVLANGVVVIAFFTHRPATSASD